NLDVVSFAEACLTCGSGSYRGNSSTNGNPSSPSPPAEQTTARNDQTGQAGTGDGAWNAGHRPADAELDVDGVANFAAISFPIYEQTVPGNKRSYRVARSAM